MTDRGKWFELNIEYLPIIQTTAKFEIKHLVLLLFPHFCRHTWVNTHIPDNTFYCTKHYKKPTSELNPNIIIIRKNRMAHSGATGICAIASG